MGPDDPAAVMIVGIIVWVVAAVEETAMMGTTVEATEMRDVREMLEGVPA